MKNLRLSHLRKVFSFMGVWEKTATITLIICILTSSVVSLNSWYKNNTTEVPGDGGEFSEAIVGQPHFINPIFASSQADKALTELVFAGLYKLDAEGKITPDLAKDLPEISADQKQYTVHLKENLRFQDSTPLTADDIVFTVQLLQNPETKSNLRLDWAKTTAEKIDDLTVKFTNSDISGPFVNNLTLPILSSRAWKDTPASAALTSELNLQPIGAGPYKIKEFTRLRNGSIVSASLVPFNLSNRPAHLSLIKLKFYDTAEEAIRVFRGKEVDALGLTSPGPENAVANQRTNADVQNSQLLQYSAVFFNTTVNPLNELAVRQAISLATNRRGLIESLNGLGDSAISHPLLSLNNSHEGVDQGIPDSKKLLDTAGWKTNDVGIRVKDGKELSITLTYPDDDLSRKTVEWLIKDWSSVGIKVLKNEVSANRLPTEVIRPRAYEALLFGHKLGADQDPFVFWHSSQIKDPGLNISGFSSTLADRLISQARGSTNGSFRQDKYAELAVELATAVPAVFLYQNSFNFFVDKGIHIKLPAVLDDASHRYDLIDTWYTKTKRVWK